MRKFTLPVIAGLFLVVLSGCAEQAPKSFSTLKSNEWSMMEVRDDVPYERAWHAVFNLLARDFDIDMALKDSGYIRTSWTHTWGGSYEPAYRVRVTARFDETRAGLSIKPEAQSLINGVWVLGTDTRLLTTLKTDLMGTIGRTTR